MNDYEFGNYLYELRKKTGLSQTQLADQLGVTNKAVSKWENGKAKPSTETIRKLASLFSVSLDTLLGKKKGSHTVNITKIVITGGPCAGKTTAMSWIQSNFTKMGLYCSVRPGNGYRTDHRRRGTLDLRHQCRLSKMPKKLPCLVSVKIVR